MANDTIELYLDCDDTVGFLPGWAFNRMDNVLKTLSHKICTISTHAIYGLSIFRFKSVRKNIKLTTNQIKFSNAIYSDAKNDSVFCLLLHSYFDLDAV